MRPFRALGPLRDRVPTPPSGFTFDDRKKSAITVVLEGAPGGAPSADLEDRFARFQFTVTETSGENSLCAPLAFTDVIAMKILPCGSDARS